MTSTVNPPEHDLVIPMTIAGKPTLSATRFAVVNPATKAPFAFAPEATEEQLDAAVRAARDAFPGWSAIPVAERQRIVATLGERLEDHAEEMMELLTREQGKPRAGAEFEIYGSVAWCREMSKMSVPEQLIDNSNGRMVTSRRTPLGVVGGIIPWNFPVILAIWKIVPALLTGNCIIVKPSPFTPLTALRLAELWRDLLPAGVFSVITGSSGDLGKAMTVHPGIDKIAFTGSTATGKDVMRASAGSLKRVTLELGGNDPAVVLPDVDIDDVAPKVFWAAFQNTAQFCNAAKRIYVHEDIYDEFLTAFVRYAGTVVVGDGSKSGTDLGPIQNEPQYKKVKEYFEDCKKNGYEFAVGGVIDENSSGWFVPITVVDNPPEDSRIVREEPFGPIVPFLKWRDEDDVVARANDTEYGLGASVWSANVDRAVALGRRIDAGVVWINEVHEYTPWAPNGGHKQSGIGCENSVECLREYTNSQTVSVNRNQ